tara:strand:+ start:4981 stop:9177 length:4197 start_codon:yes stop_codon:yes gene_type:complete
MSLIQGTGGGLGGAGAPGGALGNFYSHQLDQSIKFNEGDSSYLTRTIASAGSRTKSTFSCWFKVSRVAGSSDWSQTFYNQGNDSGAYHYLIGMYENAIYVNDYDYGSGGSPGSSIILQTNRLFRDTSAWYHLVVRIDTTQATAADRARVYVNGVDEGDTTAGGGGFSIQTINVSQSANMYVMNHTQSANGSTSLTGVKIGKYVGDYNNGYLAEINYCDGQSLGPDSFGETKDGIWIPKDTSGLTFGTNGFHLTFKDDVVSEGFNAVTYSGNGGTQSISGLGFDPDFVWVKERSNTSSHILSNSVAGPTKLLSSNTTDSEQTDANKFSSFDADGFSVGTSGAVNASGDTYVGWCWEAGGSTPSQTYTVKVVSDSGNKYRFDDFGTSAVTLNLQEGGTYTFDQSDYSNTGHPLRFSTTSNGTHGGGSEYTTGVTTTGTPGSAGAKTVITVASGAPTLYYYCTQHSGMGGQANTNSTHGSTNLKGSILSTVSTNTSKGFSVLTYTGTGSNATLAHGLDAAPEMIFFKKDAVTSWMVYNKTIGNNRFLYLDLNNGKTGTDSTYFNDTDPTDSLIQLGSYHRNNDSSADYLAYCWHSVSGYSSIGNYTGSGSAGKSVTTGFRPAFVMIKRTDTTGNWEVFDDTRGLYDDPVLYWDTVDDETSAAGRITFTSTGFTLDDNGGGRNASSGEYVYMAFADTREAAFFKDVTTNGNHFTPVNLDYRDSVPDVPSNNFATMNALANRSGTLSNGNLSLGTTTTQNATEATFQLPSSLKWYFEFAGNSTSSAYGEVGISTAGTELWSNGAGFYGQYARFNNATIASSLSFGTTDVLQVAYDGSNRKVWLGINDTWYAADGGTDGNPSAGTNESGTLAANEWFPSMWTVSNSGVMTANFGQDSSFDGIKSTANSNADRNGHGSFAFAPPTGFLALCSQNLPDPAITDGTNHFNTVLYTGDGGTTKNVTVGFNSDWTWIKSRSSGTGHHSLVDSVRGDIALNSNQTIAEYGVGPFNFNTNGTIDVPYYANDYSMNTGSATYVAWNWLAGGATPSQTYVVKVVSDSGNKYRFDDFGTSAVTLNLQEGGTYTFDQSDSSNDGHPLRFSTTSNGTHGGGSEYTTGVTTTGTPGNDGAKTVITVAASAATLYYYCTQHSGMGGQANTNPTGPSGTSRGSTNLKGSILSTVTANTTAGFSIVAWDASGVSTGTVGHGLTVAPDIIIAKPRNASGTNWFVQVPDVLANTNALNLDTDGASYNPGVNHFNDTVPTSSVFSFGGYLGGHSDLSSNTLKIAYCFHSVLGYSKVGSYTGNGNANGTFVYTGFRPAWVMIKKYNAAGQWWTIFDNVRDTYNVTTQRLWANEDDAESAYSTDQVDFVSNGFKPRGTYDANNGSGSSYIYLAFAQSPFKFANAR